MKKALSILIAGAASAGSVALAADGVVVTHHEDLASFSISAPVTAGQQKSSVTAPVVLSFDALGRRYDLVLEPNARLLSAAARQQLPPGIAVYRGAITGVPGSWARIVIAAGVPRGVIWDGSELLAIEAPGDSALRTSSGPVIFRLRDTYVVPGSMSCATERAPTSAAVSYNKLVGELQGVMAQGPGASRQLDLGAVGDFELYQQFASNETATETAIMNRLNIVDGIYSEQLGVQLSVETLDIFTSSDDPFSDSTDANALLEEIGTYRQSTPSQRSQGLTHLYTGRNLDGSTVGIAYLDALCSARYGAGLSEGGSGATFASLVTAHEIGHNFGAEHDAEAGSVCESAPPGFLMEASLNGSDQFSQCSIDSITPITAPCVSALPTVDMRIELDGNLSPVLLGQNTALSFTASNSGSQSATGVEIDVDLPNNVTFVSATTEFGSCTSGAGSVNCSYGTVPGSGSRTVDLTVTASDVGDGTFTATVSADTDVNAGNDVETVTLTVLPAVDLAVSPIAAAQADQNQSLSVTINLENRSTLDASGVEVSIDVDNGLQADAAAWPLGPCTITGQQVDCTTDNFAAQSATTLDLSLTGTLNGQSSYTVSATSAEDDANPANNSVTGSVQVGTVSMPGGGGSSSGGGGGAPSPFGLLLLSICAGLRSRRQPAPPRC